MTSTMASSIAIVDNNICPICLTLLTKPLICSGRFTRPRRHKGTSSDRTTHRHSFVPPAVTLFALRAYLCVLIPLFHL
ncbi:hypothetical protein BC832DRAFT_568623 [Gaertneriomyces semiglobifer]|nr:hypothetical protein BC832DRAFT_568623 [Gaertneriomyces semiglobifer]